MTTAVSDDERGWVAVEGLIDGQRAADLAARLPLIGPAGTAFVFGGHLLHRGTENRSSAPRPALQISFRADGVGRGPASRP